MCRLELPILWCVYADFLFIFARCFWDLLGSRAVFSLLGVFLGPFDGPLRMVKLLFGQFCFLGIFLLDSLEYFYFVVLLGPFWGPFSIGVWQSLMVHCFILYFSWPS